MNIETTSQKIVAALFILLLLLILLFAYLKQRQYKEYIISVNIHTKQVLEFDGFSSSDIYQKEQYIFFVKRVYESGRTIYKHIEV